MKVLEILSNGIKIEGDAKNITENEITIKQKKNINWPTKFAWIVIHLPNSISPIKALGELKDASPDGTYKVSFKHIFPSYKRLLLDYLMFNHNS